MRSSTLILFLGVTLLQACGQEKKAIMEERKSNPLICDVETGACENPEFTTPGQLAGHLASKGKVRLIYFTDPICSSCWGIEPQLRRLKLEYEDQIEVEYRMGGLLPDWNYNSGGISKPSDVAVHWDEVSIHYDMPIDGDVWLEDPLESSYPPSIAVKAAQMQSEHLAVKFMRALREMVFLEKKNICKWEHMAQAANSVGLDVEKLREDYEQNAPALFQADLNLGRLLGVRGFPSVFFRDENGEQVMVYGSQPYAAYEQAMQQLSPGITKADFPKDLGSLFEYFRSLTAREYAELSDMDRTLAEQELDKWVSEGKAAVVQTKNGKLYRRS